MSQGQGLGIIGTFPGSISEMEMEIVLFDRNRLDSHLFRERPTKSS